MRKLALFLRRLLCGGVRLGLWVVAAAAPRPAAGPAETAGQRALLRPAVRRGPGGLLWCACYDQIFRAPARELEGRTAVLEATVEDWPWASRYGGAATIRVRPEAGPSFLARLYGGEELLALRPGDGLRCTADCRSPTGRRGRRAAAIPLMGSSAGLCQRGAGGLPPGPAAGLGVARLVGPGAEGVGGRDAVPGGGSTGDGPPHRGRAGARRRGLRRPAADGPGPYGGGLRPPHRLPGLADRGALRAAPAAHRGPGAARPGGLCAGVRLPALGGAGGGDAGDPAPGPPPPQGARPAHQPGLRPAGTDTRSRVLCPGHRAPALLRLGGGDLPLRRAGVPAAVGPLPGAGRKIPSAACSSGLPAPCAPRCPCPPGRRRPPRRSRRAISARWPW